MFGRSAVHLLTLSRACVRRREATPRPGSFAPSRGPRWRLRQSASHRRAERPRLPEPGTPHLPAGTERPRRPKIREPPDLIIDAVPDAYRGFVASRGCSVFASARQQRCGPGPSHVTRSVPIAPSVLEILSPLVDGDPEAFLFKSARGLSLRYTRFQPTLWVPALERLVPSEDASTSFGTGSPRG